MGHEWIIDVIADLKSFAKTHDLPLLADQLEQTSLVASAEIGSMAAKPSIMMRGERAETRSIFTGAGAGRRV